jgi:hypothetical protein
MLASDNKMRAFVMPHQTNSLSPFEQVTSPLTRNLKLGLVGVFALTACAASAVTEAPAPVIEAPAPAPEPEPVIADVRPTLREPGRVALTASIYAGYQAEVGRAGSVTLTDNGMIARYLQSLGGNSADQLSSSWIAYSALIAAQAPQFARTLREIEGYYGRELMLRGLGNDLNYARSLDGAEDAVAGVMRAADSDARRLARAADNFKQQSYGLQSQGWANARVNDNDAQVGQIKQSKATRRPYDITAARALSAPEGVLALAEAGNDGTNYVLWDRIGLGASSQIYASAGPGTRYAPTPRSVGKSQTINRVATLAAFEILGAEADAPEKILATLPDTDMERCVDWAQMHLQQCVVATRFGYERPFCISEHALLDISKCVARADQ